MEKTIVHFFNSDVVTDNILHDYIYFHREGISGAELVKFGNDHETMDFYYHGRYLSYDLDGWQGERSGILLEEHNGRRTIFATWCDAVNEKKERFVSDIVALLQAVSPID